MVLVEEVAKDVNVHCGACALGGISLLVGIKSVYVVTNTRYAMCHQQYLHPTIVTSDIWHQHCGNLLNFMFLNQSLVCQVILAIESDKIWFYRNNSYALSVFVNLHHILIHECCTHVTSFYLGKQSTKDKCGKIKVFTHSRSSFLHLTLILLMHVLRRAPATNWENI